MPRKKNKRKAIQAAKKAHEPKPKRQQEPISHPDIGRSILALGVAMSAISIRKPRAIIARHQKT